METTTGRRCSASRRADTSKTDGLRALQPLPDTGGLPRGRTGWNRPQIEPGEPNLGNLYEADPRMMADRGIAILPQSLPEALDAFKADPVIETPLGPIAGEFLQVEA